MEEGGGEMWLPVWREEEDVLDLMERFLGSSEREGERGEKRRSGEE